MKKSAFLACLAVLISVPVLHSQKKDLSVRDVAKGLKAYTTIWSPEKIFINTDKVHYTQGETIWVSPYLVDGVTHKKSSNSNVVYFDIVDANGSIISKKKTFVDELASSLSFYVHENTMDGVYTIRAHTKYMQNDVTTKVYEKEIYIGNMAFPMDVAVDEGNELSEGEVGDLEVSFYPEGGQLVYGILGEVVVKSLNTKGQPIKVSGQILNNSGEVVTTFDTGTYGLAKCSFTPKKGNTYFARYYQGTEVLEQNLPRVLEKGYTLSLENMGEHIIIKAETTTPNGLKGTTLIGHMRGSQFLWFKGDKVRDNKYSVRIPSDEIQNGIAHFTLFSSKGKPLSERLAYVQSKTNKTKLSFSTTKLNLDGTMSLDFELTDEKGIPAKGNVAVSIVENDSEKIQAFDSQDIGNWLEFHSDYSMSPQAYKIFKEEDEIRRRNIIDALLVTGDWKRFSWEDLAKERPVDEYIAPEKGVFISGTTKSLGRYGKAVPAMVSLELMGPELYKAKKQTNTEGRFVFGPFDFRDSLPMVLKASRLSGGDELSKQKVVIVLDEESEYIFEEAKGISNEESLDANGQIEESQSKIGIVQGNITPKEAYDFETGKKITELKEVVVTEEKRTKKELIDEQLNEMTLYNRPTNRVFLDSLPQTGIRNIMYVLRTLPGVQVRGPEGGEFVTLRYGIFSITRGLGPLFLIDGVPTTLEAVRTLSSLDVMFIDVLKGGNAAIYGTRGAHGVIAIWTHRGSGKNYAGADASIGAYGRRSPHILTLTKKGYDIADTFETKACDSERADEVELTSGKTVLWEPNVAILGKRHKSLTFCPDDLAAGNYLVRVEGLSEDGNAISEEFTLSKPDF